MTKNYCDLCGKELVQEESGGGLMRRVNQYPISPGIPQGMFSQKTPIIEKKSGIEILELCESCQIKLWIEADKMKKEILNKAKIKLNKIDSKTK